MDPMVVLISVMVLLTVVLLFSGLGRRTDEKGSMASRLEAFRADAQARPAARGPTGTLKRRSYSGLPVLSAFLAQFKGSEAVALGLERAGVPLRVGEYYMMRWGVALIFFVAPLLFGFAAFNLGIGALLAFVGYMLPAGWVNGKRKKRMDRMTAQLVDMLGMVSNSLKSGYGLMQSIEFAARQMQPPLAVELRHMLRDANLGMSAEEALKGLGERVASSDLDMVLTAINIQRSVGGNLAEILEKVAFTMRERERIRGEISTLTAQQKMTGIVIGGLPVFMFAIFMVINPSYMGLLFSDMAGRIIMAIAVGMEVLGYLAIKRVMAIEI